jgi:hypothetical protein
MKRYRLQVFFILFLCGNVFFTTSLASNVVVPGSFSPSGKSYFPWTKQWKIERLFRKMNHNLDQGELPQKNDIELLTKLIDKCGYNPLNRIKKGKPSFFVRFFECFLAHVQSLKMDKETVYVIQSRDWYGDVNTGLSTDLLVYARLLRELSEHYGMRYRGQEEDDVKDLIKAQCKTIGVDVMGCFDASQPLSFFDDFIHQFVLWNEIFRLNFHEMTALRQRLMQLYKVDEDVLYDVLSILKHMRKNAQLDFLWNEPVAYLEQHPKFLLISSTGREITAQQLNDLLKKAGFAGLEKQIVSRADRHQAYVEQHVQQKNT